MTAYSPPTVLPHSTCESCHPVNSRPILNLSIQALLPDLQPSLVQDSLKLHIPTRSGLRLLLTSPPPTLSLPYPTPSSLAFLWPPNMLSALSLQGPLIGCSLVLGFSSRRYFQVYPGFYAGLYQVSGICQFLRKNLLTSLSNCSLPGHHPHPQLLSLSEISSCHSSPFTVYCFFFQPEGAR